MLVSQYMSATVITARPKDGLHQTWERMKERGIRHMPVLDDLEKVIGIVSDRDIRRPDTIDLGGKVDSFRIDDRTTVGEVMSDHPDTVGPDDDIGVALRLFVAHKYGALPVVDANGRAVGVLSAFDVLKAFEDSRIA